jgi:hypothetical protein
MASRRLDPPTTESFIHNARTCSNGSITSQLVEYSRMDDSSRQQLFYYSTLDSYSGPKFKGEFKTSYNLEIDVDNKTYKATTTIPGLDKVIDSLWWVQAPANNDSSLVNVKALVTDPAGLGNYTRYYTRIRRSLLSDIPFRRPDHGRNYLFRYSRQGSKPQSRHQHR